MTALCPFHLAFPVDDLAAARDKGVGSAMLDRLALDPALPEGVDPCGENGEFHTLAYDGPMFSRPLGIRVGETVLRDGFVFTDLLPIED